MIFVIPSPSVEALAGVDDLALALLATLAAFGISFTAAGGIDEVGPWVVDQFEQFVVSAGESLSDVLAQMRYGVNKAGDLIGNSYALSFNARFAQWLQTEYDLVDNSSVTVSYPSSDFSMIPYVSPLSFDNIVSGDFQLWKAFVYPSGSSSDGLYLATGSVSTHVVCIVWTFYESNLVNGLLYASDSPAVFYDANEFNNPNKTVNTHSLSGYYNSTYGLYLASHTYSYPSGSSYVAPIWDSSCDSYVVSSYSEAINLALSIFDPITLSAGSIDIPQVGDYSDDDGILIDGLGSWGDTLQDIWDKVSGLTVPDVSWPTVSWGAELADQLVDSLVSAGELTTENSPGFYNGLPLIGGIPDIQFGNLWHYVSDWVSSMSGGLALIGGIMFSLPFVAAFYALVVILLVLSLWRLLRSA